MYEKFDKMDSKELNLPETTYVRDIESRVFQSLTLQCLSKIEGIALIGGTLFDNLLGRDVSERIKGIFVEQDLEKHSVHIKVEVSIKYGLSIPQKAEEIQTKITKEVSSITGLHVSCVHVIFKNLFLELEKMQEEQEKPQKLQEEFSEGF
jgi:uncharacterized alkaline shock family protein YloU